MCTCLTYYCGGRTSKQSVSTDRGGWKEPEIALYESTLALELMPSGQLLSEKTQELQNGFRDRWQRNRNIGKLSEIGTV